MKLDRRAFLNACSSAGIASPLLPGILFTLAAQAQEAPGEKAALPKITAEMIDRAAELAGVGPFTDEQKKMMLDGLNDQRDAYAKIRALKLANDVPPAFVFRPERPVPAVMDTRHVFVPQAAQKARSHGSHAVSPTSAPANFEDLAFATITEVAPLLRARQITSLALTQMYLTRLKRYDPKLHFVITLTEERAIAQAKKADEEIAAGNYRGPLHGIPWGAKDLLAVKGYPTTWGAGGFEHQSFD